MIKQIDNYQSHHTRRSFVIKYIKTLRAKGVRYSLRKAFYKSVFPLVRHRAKGAFFEFDGNSVPYSDHKFETGHSTERTVEIPLVKLALRERDKLEVLEIGNVFSHCTAEKPGWDVVDKYEVEDGVINEDILSFNSGKKYGLIFSVSTFEHIGYDEENKDENKINKSLEHIIHSLLRPGGELFITVPLGWNPHLDQDIYHNRLPFQKVGILHRLDWAGNWKQICLSEAQFKYGKYIGADYLAILQYKQPEA